MAAYSTAFRKILLNIPKMNSEVVLHLYIQGLKPTTRLDVESKEPKTLNEAEAQALRVDDIRFGKLAQRLGPKPTQPDRRNNNQLASIDTKNNRLQKLTDRECQHLRQSGSCFKCCQPGHIAKDCTNRRNDNPTHQPSRRPLPVASIDATTSTNQSENGSRQ